MQLSSIPRLTFAEVNKEENFPNSVTGPKLTLFFRPPLQHPFFYHEKVQENKKVSHDNFAL